jgi:hypothetical protein
VHKEVCPARPSEYRRLVFGLLQDLVPGDHYLGAEESGTALPLLAEERQDVLVPEHFRVEPVRELTVGILAMAGLDRHQKELQNLPDIFDRMMARQFVCIRRVR